MYLISIALLLFILPTCSVIFELLLSHGQADVVLLVGKWFAFWAVGVRLFLAGVRQVAQPEFTAKTIFEIEDSVSFAIVREIGFGNLAMGALGLVSLIVSGWVVPAAFVGGLYYGLAGLGHLVRGHRNFAGRTAMISDLLMFVVLAAFVFYSQF
jgi:hypothetical protein